MRRRLCSGPGCVGRFLSLIHIFRRRKIGFVFQSYNLVPVLSVWENIVLPIQLDGRKVDREYVREVIGILGLEKKLKSLPNQLSGGQQQRVAIARAMACLLYTSDRGRAGSGGVRCVLHLFAPGAAGGLSAAGASGLSLIHIYGLGEEDVAKIRDIVMSETDFAADVIKIIETA